jgi:hypothetical protein
VAKEGERARLLIGAQSWKENSWADMTAEVREGGVRVQWGTGTLASIVVTGAGWRSGRFSAIRDE